MSSRPLNKHQDVLEKMMELAFQEDELVNSLTSDIDDHIKQFIDEGSQEIENNFDEGALSDFIDDFEVTQNIAMTNEELDDLLAVFDGPSSDEPSLSAEAAKDSDIRTKQTNDQSSGSGSFKQKARKKTKTPRKVTTPKKRSVYC